MSKKKKTITNTYSISYLIQHPQTRGLMFKYLSPILTEEELLANDYTLDEMFPHNMASGNKFYVIQMLMYELNLIPLPLNKVVEGEDGKLYEDLSHVKPPTKPAAEMMIENLHNTENWKIDK